MASSVTMSDYEFLDLSFCDAFPLNMTLVADEDLTIGQFLETLPSVFEPHWSSGSKSAGDIPNDCSSLSLNVLEDQRSTTLAPFEPTVWVNELTDSTPTGFFLPLDSEIVPDVQKPFDGKIPVEDTYSADIKRYMQRSGKVPNINVFAPEDDDFDAIIYPSSDDISSEDPAETPSTSVQRRVVPPPKRGKRLVSRSSSVTASDVSDYSPSFRRNYTPAPKVANRTARIKARKAAVVLHEPKDEPPVKKAKCRKTFNSACAADDLVSFAPVVPPIHNPILTSPVVASSPVDSSLTSLSSFSGTETSTASSPPKAVTTRKRKLKDSDSDEDFNEIDNDESLEFIAAKEERKKQWEPVDKFYSRRKFNNETQYRCDLCFVEHNKLHLCRREGDMVRHLQSLKHTAKSFFCSNSDCSSGFTREDALKRHMKTCKV